jgi:hypothetical protein
MMNIPNPDGVSAVLVSFGALFEYRDALDGKRVISLLKEAEDLNEISLYRPPYVEEARQNEYFSFKHEYLNTSEKVKEAYLLIANALERCVTHYRNWIEIKESLYPETFVFVRYLPDDKYDVHYDGNTSSNRAVSAVIYLDDEYEGGHIDFPLQFHTLKPMSGTILLFPSNYAFEHIANPVVSGKKHIVLGFYHDCDSIIKKDHLERYKVIE